MRYLILDHYYDSFVESRYRDEPRLAETTFAEQAASLAEGLFGETSFQVAALQELGHDALFFPVNVPQLAQAWITEHDLRLPARLQWQATRRRRLPWLSRAERPGWQARLLASVANSFEPDVIHVQCMSMVAAATIQALRAPGRAITGQSATPAMPWEQLGDYDTLFSSFPHYVERARAAGAAAHYLPLAFEPRIAVDTTGGEDYEYSFVGGLSGFHLARIDYLAAAANHAEIDVWTPSIPAAWENEQPPLRFHGPAWGQRMYEILGRSVMTINIHGEIAEGYANNLRLFEATGMGTMLLTDGRRNLDQLFRPDAEVVLFDDAAGLSDRLRYFSSHPEEARAIALEGRARTLRDHTWIRRMEQFVGLLGEDRSSS